MLHLDIDVVQTGGFQLLRQELNRELIQLGFVELFRELRLFRLERILFEQVENLNKGAAQR
jgi:hypothetical protein